MTMDINSNWGEEELEAAFAVPPETPEEVEPEAAEADPEDPTEPPEPPSAEKINLFGTDYEPDDIKGTLEFYNWAKQNPQYVQAFDAYLRGQYALVPADEYRRFQEPPPAAGAGGEGVEEPTFGDDLDPALRAKLNELDAIKAQLSGLTQESQQQRMAVAQTAVRKGADTFAEKHGLDITEMDELMAETARLGVLPHLAQQHGDMLRGVEEALEIAFYRSPKYRDREMQRNLEQQGKDLKRQRKAAALSGSSGSVPRTPGATPREQMVDEIKAAMFGGTE